MNFSQVRHTFLFGILFFSLSSFCFAEVYKWTDDDGQVHYGEKPSDKNKSVEIKLRPHKIPEQKKEDEITDTQLQQEKLLQSFDEDRQSDRAREEKEKARIAQRLRKCAIARDNLRLLQESNTVYILDDNGKRVYLQGSKREESLERVTNDVKHWCKE